MTLRPARSVPAFHRDPVGHYVAGRNWLSFCSAGFAGFVPWGCPDSSDTSQLLAATFPTTRNAPLLAPRMRYVDVRALEGFTPQAFEVMFEHLASNRHVLGASVRRLAIVYRRRLDAVIGSGLLQFLPTAASVRSFTDARAAARWLGESASQTLLALERLREELIGTTPLIVELRQLLAERPQRGLEHTAAALGTSGRTLQRQLTERGSSFQRELDAARVLRAQRLLVETVLPLGEVAYAAGFASAQHLSTVFRRIVGVPPRRWRIAER